MDPEEARRRRDSGGEDEDEDELEGDLPDDLDEAAVVVRMKEA